MYPLILKKEVEGYLSDRLQESMWRESLHIINENLASTDPKFGKIFRTINEEAQKIMSDPRILKRMEKKMAAEKISQEALDRLESTASDIDKDVKTLRKKKKPGPKKTKKERGRPKDKGR